MLLCDQCDLSRDFSNLSGFISEADSGSARSRGQTWLRTQQLGSLQEAGVWGHWLMRMAGHMVILGFLVGVSEHQGAVNPQPC